ncbi:MAG: hypothetical protein GDA43_18745 [Hormoscilla sp. SP5CHS1]|nr:hypothetical protein [Hormoscilla sp. SP5CHS1]
MAVWDVEFFIGGNLSYILPRTCLIARCDLPSFPGDRLGTWSRGWMGAIASQQQ